MTMLDRIRGWVATDADEPSGSAPLETAAEEAGHDRRQRELASPETQIEEVIAHKVLHGWLQNRNQTMMPLSVNLVRLSEADRDRVAAFAAVAARSGGGAGAASGLEDWLASAGGDEAMRARYKSALDAPQPLHVALDAMGDPNLAALAFVVALVAARDGGDGGRAFADYVAARLALPSPALRSAERRYKV